MQQYVMNVEPGLIKEVDKIVKSSKFYSSRNDFVRDAIRSKISEYQRLKIRKILKDAGKKMLERGWDGELLTKDERDKIARDFLEKKGFSID